MACAGIQTILSHVFLIGDFSVTPERHITRPITTLQTGAWQQQGFPDYSGTIQYETKFSLDPSKMDSDAILTCDVAGGCVEVFVNDVLCGTRIWEPYRVDITSALKAGENKLTLAVTNSAMDLLRPLPAEIFTDNPQYFLRDNNLRTPPSGLLEIRIEVGKDIR